MIQHCQGEGLKTMCHRLACRINDIHDGYMQYPPMRVCIAYAGDARRLGLATEQSHGSGAGCEERLARHTTLSSIRPTGRGTCLAPRPLPWISPVNQAAQLASNQTDAADAATAPRTHCFLRTGTSCQVRQPAVRSAWS